MSQRNSLIAALVSSFITLGWSTSVTIFMIMYMFHKLEQFDSEDDKEYDHHQAHSV